MKEGEIRVAFDCRDFDFTLLPPEKDPRLGAFEILFSLQCGIYGAVASTCH